jgi:hypothetical protein
MSATMSRSISVRQDFTRSAAGLADEATCHIRNRGLTQRKAIPIAAQELGTSVRRLRSLLFNEPIAVARAEYDRLCDRFLAHLDAEAEQLEARAAALRERRRRLEAGIE